MSSEQDFKCVFCSETFSQKEDLQIHFRKHGDPNFNQKKSTARSQDEAEVSAEKPKDHAEVVECDVCSEMFSSISKAITHKHKMHPYHDTKYFCPWCGKLFTMKHLYNKHMQTSHPDKEKSCEKLFHCDSCFVDFNIPAAMVYHNKFYHRQDDLPTLGHSKKLKMILEEVMQIYYCPFCGEEFDNKVNLHKHMSEDHSSENQSPEDVFRCPLCDAIFYYLDAYELHLTYHSGEDLYTERSELMDEITDFSLETVQPLQEKVECADSGNDGRKSIAIEDLLELTMGDGSDNRKQKKHKKHKKSKKAAITLDEFLNMNKDVFGEGIDFQGIEEVPTQVVAKRLKSKKVSTSSDLAKLKRQGIVVKKQSNKPAMVKKRPTNIVVNKQTLNHVQNKSSTLSSTDDVLSKLLNQGSQIKIMKKPNPDTEEHIQQGENNGKEKSNINNIEPNIEDGNNPPTDVGQTEETNSEVNEKDVHTNNSKANNIQQSRAACSPNQKALALIDKNTDLKHTLDANESNHELKESSNLLQKDPDLTENLVALRSNTNIIKNLSKQNFCETKSNSPEYNGRCGEDTPQIKEPEDEAKRNAASSEKSSLNALKHLSHLITIKPVNSNQNSPLAGCNKSENGLHKVETPKTPLPNNIPKKSESNSNFANLKNLSSITIKSTSNSQSHIPTKNFLPVEAKENDNDENDEADDEWNEDANNKKSIENNPAAEKIAHLLKSPILSVQTKHSPKILQKESPKLIANNDNSQSSADLLKHLKNVTAKPVNVSTQSIPTPKSSPSSLKRSAIGKVAAPSQEITADGIEIFNIEDSDSDDAMSPSTIMKLKHHTEIKTEKITENKSIDALKHINKNITIKSNIQKQQNKTAKKENLNHTSKEFDEQDDDWGEGDEDYDENDAHTIPTNSKIMSKPNENNVALNNVLKNLRKNITVKSRNTSPSQAIPYEDHNSKKTHFETEEDSDSDLPLGRVKITEMDNSDDEFPEDAAENNLHQLVKVQHPDDSHSEHEDGHMDEDFDDMSDIESQIEAAKVLKYNTQPSSSLNNLKHNKNVTMKQPISKATVNSKPENPIPSEEIPHFAKNLSNQISIKQIKKPESNSIAKKSEQTASHSLNQSSINQKTATKSNQLNTFNKEVKTVKTFQTQTQTKTVIQEITTTVTKTIKTVNQTTKQEVRNTAQSSSTPMIPQKIQGSMNATFSQKNFQGVKVRQAPPNIRPKIRGQAPQMTRPTICAPPQVTRAAICAPVRAANQLVPVRPALNRPSGPRPRLQNAMNVRASTSAQPRPRVGRPVKVSPGAIYTSSKKPAEAPGHFSCFKKPRESLIPEPDFPLMNQNVGESVQFSSAVQMSKSNFSSTSKIVKSNSVVTSTQTKSEMSASSQHLSKLRNMSGLSVVKTSQNQAKQTHVEENSEMSASKRNALSAIQKLQSQGLLVKKPRLENSEASDHSQPGSDDMGHDSNEEFDD